MAKDPAVSDEALTQVLGMYAGTVRLVLDNPRRWLGSDEEPGPDAGLPAKALDAVRDRALGDTTPASPDWGGRPLADRVDWWVDRIGIVGGLAAATPRFAGALADRVPVQAALGAAAAGVAVCAVAREHGRTDPAAWVPLLGRVLFDRDLSGGAPVPSTSESEQQLEDAAKDTREPPSRMAALGQGAQRAVRTLWRLARMLLDVQDLLDERPRGGLLARTIAKLPVIGLAGGWLDERGGIRKAADETRELLTSGSG